MAENLGTAVLRLEVDDTALREGLAQARRLIEGTTADVGRRTRASTPVTRFNQPNPVSPGVSVRPNSAAIEAERQLAQERLKTAAVTRKAAADELRAAQQRSKEIRNRVGGAVSSGLIGGGFPLLFGQGPGAALGGGIGGVAGGALGGGFGFALSIVGTAVGQAFDEALNKGKTLAAGLADPIGKFDELRQAGLLSSKGIEKQVQGLIAVGREAEAAGLVQADLAQSFGDISDLTTLSESYDQLARTFASLSIATAKFVEGPLTEFLDRLRASLTLSPQRQKQIEDTATQIVSQQTGPLGLKSSGFFGAIELQFQGETFKGSATGVRQALITFLSRQALEAEKAATELRLSSFTDPASEKERANILQTQEKLIEAQANGYKKQAIELQQILSLQKEERDLANLRARKATDPELEQRQESGRLERLAFEKQLESAKREEFATQIKIESQNRLALESVRERISAARQLGSLEEGVARSTLETALNIRASVAEAKRREQEIGAQIDAARIRGGDAGEAEASRLVDAQRVAAEETKLRIIEGANTLRQTGQSLKQAIIDGANRYRGVLEGSFNLLRSGVQQRLVAEARGRIDFSLFDERKLRSPQDIFSAASASEQLRDIDKEIADSSKALATVNTELVSTNKQLTEAVAALVQKDWSVNAFISPSTDSVTQSELLRASSLP